MVCVNVFFYSEAVDKFRLKKSRSRALAAVASYIAYHLPLPTVGSLGVVLGKLGEGSESASAKSVDHFIEMVKYSSIYCRDNRKGSKRRSFDYRLSFGYFFFQDIFSMEWTL